MKAEDRRREIFSAISQSGGPVTANYLSQKFGVSRQVIVQDIAMLRANGYAVISTNRGYVTESADGTQRVFKCRHSLEDMLEESNIVISNGGTVDDIFVYHRVYGKIAAGLNLSTMRHAEELYRSLASGASKPLMSVTDGYHYHTVSAPTEAALNAIESALRAAGFLIET